MGKASGVTATPNRAAGSKLNNLSETPGTSNGLKRPSTAFGSKPSVDAANPTPGKAKPVGLKAPSLI